MGGVQDDDPLTHVRLNSLPAVSLPRTQPEVVHLPDSLECQTSTDASSHYSSLAHDAA